MSNTSAAATDEKEDTTDDEDDFQDAVTEPLYEEVQVSCPPVHRRTASSVSTGSCQDGPVEAECEAETDYSSDQDDPNIRTFVKKKAKRMNSVGKNSSAMTPVKKVDLFNININLFFLSSLSRLSADKDGPEFLTSQTFPSACGAS